MNIRIRNQLSTMRIIQHNCCKSYSVTITALKAELSLKADIICLQEFYINSEFRHEGFLIHWSEREEHKNKQVITAVCKNWAIQINIKAHTNLIDHFYIMTLNIWKQKKALQKSKTHQTCLINCYNNWIRREQLW